MIEQKFIVTLRTNNKQDMVECVALLEELIERLSGLSDNENEPCSDVEAVK